MTPVEMVLAGLAGCLTAGVAAVATNRGVKLHSVTATLEGDMDIQGILGIDPEVRNGFGGITVTLRDRRRRGQSRARGHRRPVAEALGRLRHRHQPDQRRRRGRLSERRRRGASESIVNVTAVVVIGAGPAGLAMSRCLRDASIDHVRARAGRGGPLVAARAMGLAPNA